MHILKMKTLRYVIHTISIAIIMEPICRNHFVNLRLGRKSQAFNIWLRQYYTEQTVMVTSKTNYSHNGFREQRVM